VGLWEQPRIDLTEEVKGALTRALEEAARRRNHDFTEGHLVWALLACPSVASAVALMGLEPAALRAAVARDLDALPAAGWLSFRAPDTSYYRSELTPAVARAAAAGRPEVTAPMLLAHLMKDIAAGLPFLAGAGFSVLAFRRAVSHGDLAPPPVPEEGLVTIVALNDPFTTMEHVVATLREVFGVTGDAEKLMMTVHHTGRAVITTTDAATARKKIDEAHARAEAAGMPLRVIAEVVESAPRPSDSVEGDPQPR
jgi:ATP-dependent Clp protease adaptor protein ClpS